MGTAKPVGVIKKEQSGFQVFESGLQLCFKTSIYGAVSPYTSFALTKRGVENDVAMLAVANQLGVPLSAVTSCGRKDSFAETVQEIVVAGPFRPQFDHDRIWLKQLGIAPEPLRLGNHAGNTFSIKVYTEHTSRQSVDSFKNYFGYQRFGGGNVEAGRYLLEGEYEKAFDAWEGTREQSLRDRRAGKKDYGHSLSKTEVVLHQDLEQVCFRSIQSWQSHLWNCLAAETTASYYGQRLPFWTEETADLYDPWWNPTEFSEAMLKLAYPLNRLLIVKAQNLQSVRLNDGWRYRFTLRSGAYATVFLASHFNLRDASVERFEERREAQKASL